MTEKKESKKLKRPTVNKETIADLEVKQDDKMKGGTQLVTVDDPATRPFTAINCIKPR